MLLRYLILCLNLISTVLGLYNSACGCCISNIVIYTRYMLLRYLILCINLISTMLGLYNSACGCCISNIDIYTRYMLLRYLILCINLISTVPTGGGRGTRNELPNGISLVEHLYSVYGVTIFISLLYLFRFFRFFRLFRYDDGDVYNKSTIDYYLTLTIYC